MIEQSKIYSFLDKSQRFSLQFLEGQKMIHDLLLLQPLNQSTFAFLRDSLLSLIPLNIFQKNMETLGVYIDSDQPFFRFKLELSFQGTFRTLLIPHDIKEIPNNITGFVRVIKAQGSGVPYTSILETTKQTPFQITDHVIKQTYQIEGQLLISPTVDQSILAVKLPKINVNEQEDQSLSLSEFLMANNLKLNEILATDFQSSIQISDKFSEENFQLLNQKDIKFFCPCSHDQMVNNLKKLPPADIEHVFETENPVHLTCDYCRKEYFINKLEVESLREQ